MADTVKKLSVKFEGDTKKLNTAIKDATEGFNDISKAAKNLDSQFEKFGTGASFDKQTQALKLFEEQIKSGEKSLQKLIGYRDQLLEENADNALSSEFQRLNKIIAETTDTIAKAKTRVDECKASLSNVVKEGADISKITEGFEKIRQHANDTNKQFQNTQSYINAINKALEYSPNNVELLNLQTQKYEEQLKICRSETQSLATNLSNLKKAGVNELSQEFLELENRLNENKAKYQELKLETASYYKALSEAGKLANDIATRGNQLKSALEVDPTNTELLSQYQKVLQEEIDKSVASENAFRKAINEINPKGVINVKEQYIELTTGLTKAKAQTKYLREEQAKYTDEVVTYSNKMEKFKSTLSQTSTTANVLKKALELDPTNLKKQQEYADYLSKAIKECKDQQTYFNNKLKEMDTKGVDKTSKGYVETLKNLNDVVEKEKQFNTELTNLTKTVDNTKKYAEQLKKALQLDPTNTQKQKEYTDFLATAIEKCKNEQIKLNKELEDMNTNGVEKTSSEYVELLKTLNDVTEEQQNYEAQLNATNNALNETANAEENAVVKTADFNTGLNAIHQVLQKVSTELNNLTSSLFDNAMSYESNIASIKKVVTDLSDDTVDSLKEIAVASGNTFDSIAEYATLGATLGIAQDALADFTDAMVKLEAASDGSIAGEEGAKAVARLLNQFDIGAQYAENFGSAVTYVGDQFAATANEILETASYMGGLSAINNVTINDLIGLASEMKNLGIETASGASAISKTFLTIETQVETSGKKLETFASTAGMTSEEFKKAWESAPTDTFLKFINGLSTEVFDEINEAVDSGSSSLSEYASALDVTTDSFKAMWKQDAAGTFEKYKDALGDLEEGSESASVTLTDLSLSGVRVAQTLLKLAGNGDVVKKAIKDSSKAWKENTNLTKKANTVYETTEKKLESAKEAIRQAAAALGDTFLPLVKSGADMVTSLAKTFNSLPSAAKTAISGTALLATGIAEVGTSAMGALSWLNQMSMGSSNLSIACGNLLSGITGGGGLVAALGTALPVALGLAGAAFVINKMYVESGNKALQDYHDTMDKVSQEADETFRTSLRELNTEMASYKEAIDNAISASENLEFDENGKVDTTKDSYKRLVEAVDLLNDSIGSETGTIYQINKETGAIEDQTGKLQDLGQEYENLRVKKERELWLTSHQEEYNKALEQSNTAMSEADSLQAQINEKWQKFLDLKTEYKKTGELFTEEDLRLQQQIIEGTINENDLTQEQIDKQLALKEALGGIGTGLDTLYGKHQAYAEILKDSKQTIEDWDSIANSSLDEVHTKIANMTAEENIINLEINKEDQESVMAGIQEIDNQIKALQQNFAMGLYTQEQYDSELERLTGTKTALEEQLGVLQQEQQYIEDTASLAENASLRTAAAITSATGTTSDSMIYSFNNVDDTLSSVFKRAGDNSSSMFKTMDSNSATTATNLNTNFKNVTTNVGSNIKSTTNSGTQDFASMYEKILSNTKDTFTGKGGVQGTITDVTKDTASTIASEYLGGNGLWSKFAAACKGAVDKVIAYFDSLKNYGEINQTVRITTIHDDVYVSSYKASSYGGGGSRSGGFNSGYTSLVPNLTIPKLSSGGHGAMTLKANFTINNNGDNITQAVSQKIGKQIVNYINEELGKGI